MTTSFIPGEYWTRERARDAVDRMAKAMSSPELQELMKEIADAAAAGADPAALAAQMIPAQAAVADRSSIPIDGAACTYRRGRSSDTPYFARLIVAGELPPLFIEEFVEGFVAVEHGGELVGCGGLEIYGDCGVIRSVVVDERARGQRIAQRIAALLMEDAREAKLNDAYLFTMDAYTFWRRLGFVDAPLDTWKEAPRSCWQYVFVEAHPEAAGEIHSMWRPVAN